MKKVKGSALLWCLSVLIVLSVLTLTAVALSVRYYKSCMDKAGNNQADYNSEAAVKMLKSQLQSKFGGKQIYFTYEGESMLDISNPSRELSLSEKDIEYFGSAVEPYSGNEEYFVAVRDLENRLVSDYIRNRNGVRQPVKMTFNYGRIDTSVFNHGYYGDSAELLIDSIECVDEDHDGTPEYYVAVVKAVTTLNTGHTAAVGAKFRSRKPHFNADVIPAASCKMMRVGISPEDTNGNIDYSGNTELLRYKDANGIRLGLEGDGTNEPCVLAFGDSYGSGAFYDKMEEAGFIKTDGFISDEDGSYMDEISFLDPISFRIADASGYYAFRNYTDMHQNGCMTFSPEYLEKRVDIEYLHYFPESNIFENESMSKMKVYYELPEAVTAGNAGDNRAKRYYVTSGGVYGASDICYYDNSGVREYSMSFANYTDYLKNDTNVFGDSDFKDMYSTSDGPVCCIVENRLNNGDSLIINTDEEISLENIVLENGRTYFFRICQNTKISFDPVCYDPNTCANVYFQLYGDKECNYGMDYPIELKLVNPPQNMNFFAFDHSRPDDAQGEDVSAIKPSSASDSRKNVTVIVNNDTPDGYTLSGYFSCYMLSVFDESINSDSSTGLGPKNVYLKSAKPSEFFAISENDEEETAYYGEENKSYTWVFDSFVYADSSIS